jgi:ribonucleoside-diphosphate reductase alpha chain
MSTLPGPQTSAAITTFKMKYCQPGEDYRDVCNRVAGTITDGPDHFRAFRDVLLNREFVLAGRNMTALGTTKRVTAYNCFVSGCIEDSLFGDGGIMNRLQEGAKTMQMGGGIGYDFSPIRPRGDTVRSLGSRASGPVSYLEMYDAMGRTISSSGERRGAQMGILRIDHPDIEEFIHAKQNGNRLTCFNLSVAVTDRFMEAVLEGDNFNLEFEGRRYRTVDARALWDVIMRSTWDWAEPGVVFIDQINEMNNLSYCEDIAATNPCAEQPLPPFGACLLGSINLPMLLKPRHKPSDIDGRFIFQWAKLKEIIGTIVRAMDNIVDATIYPLFEQENQAKATRRMGIGVMGLANCVEAMGFPYGSDGFIHEMSAILRCIRDEAYRASAMLAKEKGTFKRYDARWYLDRPFIKTLPADVRELIQKYGIRNSHLTSIAPTGTISFCMDNVSSGIEPVFSERESRRVKTPDGDRTYDVVDYGTAMGIKAKCSGAITAEEHVRVLCEAQRFVDSSISKTCNVPSDMAWEGFKDIYQKCWEGGAKGCATFRVEGKRGGIRESIADASCEGGVCAMQA